MTVQDGEGVTYYRNTVTGETVYEKPADFVAQPELVWETLQDEEGCHYYWNTATHETTYEQPSQLSKAIIDF